MRRPALSLRLLIPGLLALVSLTVGIGSYRASRNHLYDSLAQHTAVQLRNLLAQMQGPIERMVQRGNLNDVRLLVSELGAQDGLHFAVLSNADGQVLAATRLEWIGQKVTDLPELHATTPPQERHTLTVVDGPAEFSHYTGWVPVCAGEPGQGLRDVPCGELHIVQGPDSHELYEIDALDRYALSNLITTSGGVLAVLVLLHLTFSRRLARLDWLARRVSADDLDARARLGGFDELTAVGAALDDMLDRLTQQQQRLRVLGSAVEQSPMMVIVTDPDGLIQYVNASFSVLTGYKADEVLGQSVRLLKSGDSPTTIYRDLWTSICQGRQWHGELHNRRRNGETYWVEATIYPLLDMQGRIAHYLSLEVDISERKAYEERLLHQAQHDSLTGLPNRLLGLDRLHQAVRQARQDQQPLAVLILNLDHFQRLIDHLGHDAGDVALRVMADRLRSVAGDAASLARMGNDEFLLLLSDRQAQTAAKTFGQRLLAACAEPLPLGDPPWQMTARIGISLCPQDGSDAGDLLRDAQAACAYLRERGGADLRFFTHEIDASARETARIEQHLRHAIERNELSVHFQPLIHAIDGRPIGAEALLRWRNDELGPVGPDRFIPIAESSGLIVSIGLWVLEQACAAAADWSRLLGRPLMVAVNVSANQFDHDDFIDHVLAIVARHQLAPDQLEIEITERMLINDHARVETLLRQLRQAGVRLSIDDFGTGYSALSYLKRFPFTTLKIDRSFVRDLPGNIQDASLVSAILAMAHNLNLDVVAEGVETAEQAAYLRERGCDILQGYHLGRPMPAEDVIKLLDVP